MRGEPYDAGDRVAEGVDMLGPHHFEPTVHDSGAKVLKMGKFRRDAAEVVPHAADHPLASRRVQLRQRTSDVATRPIADPETRPDAPRDSAADGRGQSIGSRRLS